MPESVRRGVPPVRRPEGVSRRWQIGKDPAMGRPSYHHYHRWTPARRPFGSLLVMLCVAALASAGMIALAVVAMLLTVGPPILAAVGAVTVARHVHRRRARSRQLPEVAPPASAVAAPPVPDWRATPGRFGQ